MPSKFILLYSSLILLRLLFAVSQSYIHPDEMFQGSEVIVGDIFGWQTIRTWEFLETPIRSIVPIYLFQAPVLYHLRMFTAHDSPRLIFYAIRIQQFLWSLVLDALLYAITRSKTSMLLFASSYTTMTYQTHAFSNAWESIIVLGTLCASQGVETSLLLGSLACLGIFTRISFAAFMIPLAIVRVCKMVAWDETAKAWLPSEPEIQRNAFAAVTFTICTSLSIYLDTYYYSGRWIGFLEWHEAIYTIWNNLVYNTDVENLAEHGLHPRYTHLLNLLVLLGPGVLLLGKLRKNIYTASMMTGFLTLSLAPHQEARFLLPCIVLFFAGLRAPIRISRTFWILWIVFNAVMALFMGLFHQCGVVPAALHIAQTYPNASVTWTKSYPAPKFLLGPGVSVEHLYGDQSSNWQPQTDLYVAPISHEPRYDAYQLVYRDDWHVNLDDIDDLGWKVLYERGVGIYKHIHYAA